MKNLIFCLLYLTAVLNFISAPLYSASYSDDEETSVEAAALSVAIAKPENEKACNSIYQIVLGRMACKQGLKTFLEDTDSRENKLLFLQDNFPSIFQHPHVRALAEQAPQNPATYLQIFNVFIKDAETAIKDWKDFQKAILTSDPGNEFSLLDMIYYWAKHKVLFEASVIEKNTNINEESLNGKMEEYRENGEEIAYYYDIMMLAYPHLSCTMQKTLQGGGFLANEVKKTSGREYGYSFNTNALAIRAERLKTICLKMVSNLPDQEKAPAYVEKVTNIIKSAVIPLFLQITTPTRKAKENLDLSSSEFLLNRIGKKPSIGGKELSIKRKDVYDGYNTLRLWRPGKHSLVKVIDQLEILLAEILQVSQPITDLTEEVEAIEPPPADTRIASTEADREDDEEAEEQRILKGIILRLVEAQREGRPSISQLEPTAHIVIEPTAPKISRDMEDWMRAVAEEKTCKYKKHRAALESQFIVNSAGGSQRRIEDPESGTIAYYHMPHGGTNNTNKVALWRIILKDFFLRCGYKVS